MDRIEEASIVIKDINRYRNNQIKDYDLIKTVCHYFDGIKDESISDADLRFLKFISNLVGIPHFYDLLSKFNNSTEISNFDLNTISAIIYESTLNLTENNKVHKYQKEILNLYKKGRQNRYFLSASTSFGKTHIVFDIIKRMDYKNVVLIFPTIALLSENLEKLSSDNSYNHFIETYSIHTLSEVSELSERNLFIYTPERYLSFIEKREDELDFDFAFVDEVYKIDNNYIIDEEVRENERDVAYRLAVYYSLKNDIDILLAGPYIDFSKQTDSDYNNSFDNFLQENSISLINYNNYEIVNKNYTNIKSSKKYIIDDTLTLNFSSNNKTKRLIESVNSILEINENSIIYCYSRNSAESYAKHLIESNILSTHNSEEYSNFISHISKNFSKEWTLIKALQNGIGIHHGLIPKYIQKEIVSLFNKGLIRVLLSTTTITEGVNTSAKNLIVLHDRKGNKPLKKFDAKNIAGRAGRFLYHYSGRVIVLKNGFMDAINKDAVGIKHKNYDIDSPKDEIDLYYTKDEYLKQSDKSKKRDIHEMQRERNIPDSIFGFFKVISRVDKMIIYDRIKHLTDDEIELIKKLIRTINFRLNIDYDGFQLVLNIIEPIIKNQELKSMIEYKKDDRISVLTHYVYFYLRDGFKGSISFKLNQGLVIDKAISESAKFVYNTLKYQVVKYLGVFNIMYKHSRSEITKQPFEEVSGIDRLLTKFEYNAFTENGRIASDFGVPTKVVEYYENPENSNRISEQFDSYEKEIFKKVENIINK